MMNRVKSNLILIFIFMVIVVLAACSNSPTSKTESPQDQEPDKKNIVTEVWDENGEEVTVKVLYPWGEDAFQQFIVGTYKDALPKNITLECVCVGAQLEPLQEMNAKGIIPDMMFANWGIDDLDELEMLEPVDEYVEKYGVDLSEFNQSVIATYRAMDPEGKDRLIGMPTFVDSVGLFYNKDVFDLFGVPYPDPEKPMTWKELLDLATKLTGERNGVQYRGLEMGLGFTSFEATFPLKEFGINLTDPKTGEVLITESPEVKQYLELMQKFYNIPGLYDPAPEARETDKFAQKTVAMTVSWPGYYRWGLGEEPEESTMIDSAPVPVWEGEGKGPQAYAHPYVLNKFSENKDAAFQVMLAISKVDSMDPLTSPNSEFSDSSEYFPIYEGKNLQPFFNYESAMPPKQVSKWDNYVDIPGSLNKLAEGDSDINEFLRVLKEESEIKIKDAMAK
ncbi:ABC transporter substrate-binding protein [Bacillus sp. FSL K6-3431]|uniref:ABC transporter substrate-binding protein n=1 Tax=Bacillus sp. FSL K6-3431 TaxID=2921500 RepID=UPI0030F9520C